MTTNNGKQVEPAAAPPASEDGPVDEGDLNFTLNPQQMQQFMAQAADMGMVHIPRSVVNLVGEKVIAELLLQEHNEHISRQLQVVNSNLAVYKERLEAAGIEVPSGGQFPPAPVEGAGVPPEVPKSEQGDQAGEQDQKADT